MKLFINEGICERIWNGNVQVTELPDSKIKLSIPNYIQSKREHEYVNFILPDVTERDIRNDILLEEVSLEKTRENTYHFKKSKGNRQMYALLRSTEVIPDDIFIPASMKDRVQVVRRMRFIDDEVDYGGFLSNVYLIKLFLGRDDYLPVYFTTDFPQVLTKHYVFYNPSWNEGYRVSDKLETMILINASNRKDYISLSSLCEK